MPLSAPKDSSINSFLCWATRAWIVSSRVALCSLCCKTESFLAVSLDTFTVVDSIFGIKYSGIFKTVSM